MGPGLKFFLSLFFGTGFCFFYAQTGAVIVDSIKEGTIYRGYRLYVPASYTAGKKIPLVLNFHGLGSNGYQQESYGNFKNVADTGYFIVAHPEGIKNGSSQYWNAGLLAAPDDVQFVSHLIDSVGLIYNVDADRVYACGLSNGAILSYYLACQLPHRIAAIASVAGTMFRPWFNLCKPPTAKPVLIIHGTDDGTVAYEGSSTPGINGLYMPVDTIVEKWRAHNQCQPTPVVKQLADKDLTDYSNVTHVTYSQGADNSSVELFKVNGGSHSWPGATPAFFHQNMDFNASVEIWRFFSKYKISQFSTQVGIVEPDTDLKGSIIVFPNPASDKLIIRATHANRFVIISVEGKKVCETTADCIDLGDLSPGLYVVEAWNDNHCVRKKFVRQ